MRRTKHKLVSVRLSLILMMMLALSSQAQVKVPSVQLKNSQTPSQMKDAAQRKAERKPSPKASTLTSVQRLTREFEKKRIGAYYGIIMHSLDRILSGEQERSEFDSRVQKAMELNPGLSKEYLAQMVADYKAVPLEVKIKAMPRDLAEIALKTPLNNQDVHQLMKAEFGSTNNMTVKSNALRDNWKIQQKPRPYISGLEVKLQGNLTTLVLKGRFESSSELAVVYLKPVHGESLDGLFSETVNGEKVGIVFGKIRNQNTVIATIPVSAEPGDYDVSVRVPKDKYGEEIRTNSKRMSLVPYAYQVELVSIKCVDESNPETYLLTSVSDEIKVFWAAYVDGGYGTIDDSQEYDGFDDGVEKTIGREPRPDAVIFFDADNYANYHGNKISTPVTIAKKLFLNFRLMEVDGVAWGEQDVTRYGSVMDFLQDLDRDAVDIEDENYQAESVSQRLNYVLANLSGFDPLGEVRLTFSAGELQAMTNNDAKIFRGKMSFANDDATGTYEVKYQIRRYVIPIHKFID